MIKEAFIKNKVDVDLLIAQLCATSAVKHKQKYKQIPIFDKEVFEKIESIDEFWERLRGLLTICNFDLVKFVLEISDCIEAQDILKDFLPKFDPSAVEDLEPYWEYEPWVRLPMPVLSATVDIEKFSLKVIKSFEEMMLKIYELNECALHFIRAEQGPVVLHYYITKSLSSYIANFSIPISAERELYEHHVLNITIKSREKCTGSYSDEIRCLSDVTMQI